MLLINLFFSWRTNNVTDKIDERITHLANNLYTHKDTDCQTPADVKMH